MTNNELLDAILNSYLYGLKLKFENSPEYKKLTFEFIAKAQNPDLEEWQLKFLRQTLINDGFIEPAKISGPEPYHMTPTGIKAAQTGWYKKTENDLRTKKEITKQTLADLKRSKISLIVAILAFIIPTIISIYTFQANKQQPNRQELQELRQRLEKLESLKNEAYKDTTSSFVSASDLKKKNNKLHPFYSYDKLFFQWLFPSIRRP
jgi:hypothetical protein